MGPIGGKVGKKSSRGGGGGGGVGKAS